MKIPCQFFIFSITPKSFWKNGWKLSLNCEFAWQIYKEPRSFHHLNTYGFFSMNSPKWFPFYDNPIAYLIGRSIIFNLSFFIIYPIVCKTNILIDSYMVYQKNICNILEIIVYLQSHFLKSDLTYWGSKRLSFRPRICKIHVVWTKSEICSSKCIYLCLWWRVHIYTLWCWVVLFILLTTGTAEPSDKGLS